MEQQNKTQKKLLILRVVLNLIWLIPFTWLLIKLLNPDSISSGDEVIGYMVILIFSILLGIIINTTLKNIKSSNKLNQQNNILSNTSQAGDKISYKLFWVLYLLSNLVWIIMFMESIIPLLKGEAGIAVIVIIPALIISILMAIIINTTLLVARRRGKRKLLVTLSCIFIVIGILIYIPILFFDLS
jgi:hypothetical protein